MQYYGRWANFGLILIAGMVIGCGGKASEKPVEKQPQDESTMNSVATDQTHATTKTFGANRVLPAQVNGPVPVAEQIDPAIQTRISAFAGKFQEQIAKRRRAITETFDLKEIGIAFHNFQDSHQHLPALNGSGDQGAPHPGLSWRVYLLPYLHQEALFAEFKLDEAWDSEHNKALISKMPSQFGTDPEGKSRIHVLAGRGTAFQEEAGKSLFEAMDGASFVLMAVEAGADTAEFWTKPGGLPFDPREPLKCLGNVEDQFLVLMMDGSVRKWPKSISPELFTNLAQMSDGNVVDLEKIGQPPVGNLPAAEVPSPITPLQPTTARLSLSYIPQDAFAALVLHPRRILANQVVNSIQQLIPPTMLPGDSWQPQIIPVLGSLDFSSLGNRLGIAPQNIDELVILFDKEMVQTRITGAYTVPPLGVIFRNSAPLDVDRIVATIAELPLIHEVVQHEGVSLIVSASTNSAVAFITDSMLVAGQIGFVKKMISVRGQVTATSGLTASLDAAGNRLVVLAVDGDPVESAVGQLASRLPGPLALFSPYLTGAKELALTFDLEAAELLQVRLQFKTPLLANGLFGMLDSEFKKAKTQATNAREKMISDAVSKDFIPYLDQLVAESTLVNDADTIHFALPKLKNLDRLPDLFKPAIKKIMSVAERTKLANDLGQIGIAFLTYHDQFNRFPALNGPGPKNRPHPGLSWRVYLLPYLDQAALYQKFKLDEPWDSEHNLSLVAMMPRIYGPNPDGKSSIHVFTGPGAPFQNDGGLGVVDITDGMTNTLLAVDTGTELLEIWTKPGGLVFDPADPLKCLGDMKEVHALMMDGSRRVLEDITPQEFSKLVQHQDGQRLKME